MVVFTKYYAYKGLRKLPRSAVLGQSQGLLPSESDWLDVKEPLVPRSQSMMWRKVCQARHEEDLLELMMPSSL